MSNQNKEFISTGTIHVCVIEMDTSEPENPEPENPEPENPVPEDPVPENPVPEDLVPEDLVPEDLVPENLVPENLVPEDLVPEDPSPNQSNSEKPQTKYSVEFSPDPDHTFTDKLKHKYAVFLNKKTSVCDRKKTAVISKCDCKRLEVSSIVQPLEIGIVKLCVNDESWENKNWGNVLSNCAISQTKIDVFVNEELKLIGFRIPAIRSVDKNPSI